MRNLKRLMVGAGTLVVAVAGGIGLSSSRAEAAPPAPRPELTVNVIAPAHINPGDPLVYELRVRNSGTAPAFGVQVRDHVDNALNIDVVVAGGGFGCAVAGQTVLCGGANLGPGDVATIVIRTHARPGFSGVTAPNHAEVDPFGNINEIHDGNNHDWAVTLIA